MTGGGLISVEEALARVLASARESLAEESVALGDALGRTLAREVRASRAQPPFASSAMDGYALRAANAAQPGARLAAVGESAAGRAFFGRLAAGQAVRIFTGAPMPDGADAVVAQEEARREGDTVALEAGVSPGENVRARGSDFEAGETMLAAGRRLTPRDVALAAAADCPRLVVRRRPRVAILATGDELVAPGAARGPAQIVASNNFAIAGVVVAAGGEPIDLGIAADDPNALARSLAAAREAEADVLATLGGASVGDHDLVRGALAEAGMELGFWRIAMRPGKPLIHGRLGAMSVLGLPGNPTSSTVCALLFLRPLLRALVGDPEAGADPSEPARLGAPLSANGARKNYLRATLMRDGDGAFLARPVASQDSSLVKTLARAEALIVRAPDAPPAEAGAPCRIIRFAALGA
jgi:molybdopterin molybdotransferase